MVAQPTYAPSRSVHTRLELELRLEDMGRCLDIQVFHTSRPKNLSSGVKMSQLADKAHHQVRRCSSRFRCQNYTCRHHYIPHHTLCLSSLKSIEQKKAATKLNHTRIANTCSRICRSFSSLNTWFIASIAHPTIRAIHATDKWIKCDAITRTALKTVRLIWAIRNVTGDPGPT